MFGIGIAELLVLLGIFGVGVFVVVLCLVIILASRAGNRGHDDGKK